MFVAQQRFGLVQPEPPELVHFFRRDEGSTKRAHQPVAHRLRASPAIDVVDAPDRALQCAAQSGLFLDLAYSRLLFGLARVGLSFRERPIVVLGSMHQYDLHESVRADPPDDTTGGPNLAGHDHEATRFRFRRRHAAGQASLASRPHPAAAEASMPATNDSAEEALEVFDLNHAPAADAS